ncbi:MAG: VanZ family protein [Candidatus Omnitrophica bacterium]|nr:VanZ family protein [Candidatus Omnitrophota bacterium]
MRHISKITIALAVFIVVSASFMLQLRTFLAETFGEEVLRLAFYYFLAASVICYCIYKLYRKLPVHKLIWSIIIFVIAYLLMSRQEYFSEKIHILEYGVLGFLALKDLFKGNRPFLMNIVFALFFIALVGVLDEGFQWVLPYREFEVKDIITNILSGFLGMLQLTILISRKKL